MTFAEDMARVATQVSKRRDQVQGEEAIKQALILPFISALGYDIHHPAEVRPEYTADFAVKKAGQFEKVDYALCLEGRPVVFLEAKTSSKTRVHDGQLQRYFNATPTVKVAVISNGLEYRFFTDLQNINLMDAEPFFTFNVLEHNEKDLETLSIFHRDSYRPEKLSEIAKEMFHLESMKRLVSEILKEPPESFIRYLLHNVGYSGRVTLSVVSSFQPIIKRAIQGSLVEFMARSIGQQITSPPTHVPISLETEVRPARVRESTKIAKPQEPSVAFEEQVAESDVDVARELTSEELEFLERVKRILTKCEPQNEVYCKTATAYFALHFGRSSSWFLRFILNSRRKSLIVRLEPDEVLSLAGHFEVRTVTEGMGTCQVILNGVNDLPFLRPLINRAYEDAVGKLEII